VCLCENKTQDVAQKIKAKPQDVEKCKKVRKNIKNFKKGVDKSARIWYINQARRGERRKNETAQKTFSKNLKKVLDKVESLW